MQLAIVNTRSGVRRSPERLRAVFDRVGKVAARTSFTEYGGHARELAAAEGAYDGLTVIGATARSTKG